jgi:hypothetical protein
MNEPLIVDRSIIESTIAELQTGGRVGRERVVLWLGRRSGALVMILESYVPYQEADRDFFRIPHASIAKILKYLQARHLMIGAQVHSHPLEAFHSEADDAWAIIRHAGALSFVLPYFAMRTSVNGFEADAVAFRLKLDNTWERVPPEEVRLCYRIE